MDINDSYLETNYIVDELPQPIRISEYNLGLNELLKNNNCTSWAYVTAYNPFSKKLSDDENILLNKKLEFLLSFFKIYKGRGCGFDDNWAPEESFLILGISKRDAIELGQKFEQNAIVFGSIDSIPELITILY